MSDSLWSHGWDPLSSTLLCPPLSPRVCLNSLPLSWWFHLIISSFFTSSPFAFNLFQHQGLFQWEGFQVRWLKYWSWSFSFKNSPSKEYSGLISFRIDWFDLLAVHGTLKSSPALQFKSVSSSALSLLYGPALTSIRDYWKNHSFDYMDLLSARWCLCFLICCLVLSAFLPRNKHLLISWLQPLSTVTLEPKKVKSVAFPFFSHLFAMK